MELERFEDSVNKFQYYLVQYAKAPYTVVWRVVKSDDIKWNKNDKYRVHNQNLLIRDQGKLFLGNILHKTIDEKEALEKHKNLQKIFIKFLRRPGQVNKCIELIHFDRDFWLLVTYNVMTDLGERNVYAIYHKHDAILKRDIVTNNIIAYVQDDEYTHKGIVLRASNNLRFVVIPLNLIRIDVLGNLVKYFKNKWKNRFQRISQSIAQLQFIMCVESFYMFNSYIRLTYRKTRAYHRLMYLKKLAHLKGFKTDFW